MGSVGSGVVAGARRGAYWMPWETELKVVRQALGFTQVEVAAMCGCSVRSLIRAEAGEAVAARWYDVAIGVLTVYVWGYVMGIWIMVALLGGVWLLLSD